MKVELSAAEIKSIAAGFDIYFDDRVVSLDPDYKEQLALNEKLQRLTKFGFEDVLAAMKQDPEVKFTRPNWPPRQYIQKYHVKCGHDDIYTIMDFDPDGYKTGYNSNSDGGLFAEDWELFEG